MDEAAIALARPWALALLILPLLALRFLPPSPPRSALRPPPGVARWLADAAGSGAPRAGLAGRAALPALGWIALVVALAGPLTRGEALVEDAGRDLLLAVDLSASMADADISGGRDRMAAAQDAIGGVLAARRGDRVGLIGFASEAYLVAPLSHDVAAVGAVLAELTVGLPGRRTDLGQAIGLGAKVLRGGPPGERRLVVLTDGDTNAGDLAAHDAAALAAAADIRVDLIGFAAAVEPASAAFMAEIAAITGGAYREATSPDALAAALAAAMRDGAAPAEGREAPKRLIEDWAGPFVAFALAVALAVAWREWRDA